VIHAERGREPLRSSPTTDDAAMLAVPTKRVLATPHAGEAPLVNKNPRHPQIDRQHTCTVENCGCGVRQIASAGAEHGNQYPRGPNRYRNHGAAAVAAQVRMGLQELAHRVSAGGAGLSEGRKALHVPGAPGNHSFNLEARSCEPGCRLPCMTPLLDENRGANKRVLAPPFSLPRFVPLSTRHGTQGITGNRMPPRPSQHLCVGRPLTLSGSCARAPTPAG
jgi:hypothetical protein